MTILDSIHLYSEAAETFLNDPASAEFDYFIFQEPFQAGGKNFHEAGRLLAEVRQ